jgi:uncharacterized membrane protein
VSTNLSRRERAKQPRTVVAGPYGHPIHPLLVTVPIGSWVAAFLFDIASRSSSDGKPFAEAAYWLIGLGVISALLAAVFGLMDLMAIPTGTKAFRVALTHLILNVTVVVLFAISFLIRAADVYGKPTSVGLFILSIVALAILTVSGWLGGMMAYHYGVRVADDETQREGFAQARVTSPAARPTDAAPRR